MLDESVYARHQEPGFLEELYETGATPWEIGRPQPAFLALAKSGAIQGRVLDVGCGTGEHVLMCAQLGLDSTGVELAANAVRMAEEKASERGLTARFLRYDALKLAELGETFDTVLDCGLFHRFQGDERTAYVDSLKSVVQPGKRVFVLSFSDQQEEDWGPHRVSRAEFEAAFAEGWRIDAIEESTIDATVDADGIRAWLVSLTRV
ncbi:class I SAM-dependent methyltransferase [Streptomyces ipomoeae]|uniref:class I SAM-dependent methyltransferase n=1 Tax=Streptomyces ipomoeae TaxID=103232 RepID=UPI001146CE08|nr:class I SAM-dependent methyltransferase [Streptomyces ipomoeae]MDX2938447.1 class I SAM-dependent methyltransferase [Streptomyces ipomoeae]TQE17081.1 class I SAM-dependent methyltransferase [Streptomyces ipomoeae]